MSSTPECARRLRQALASAEQPLRAIAEASSRQRPADKWSPREIIGHLIDSASNNHQRFVRASLQSDMVFPGYAQEEWVALQRYQERDWSDLLALWLAFNRHLVWVMAEVPEAVRLQMRARHNFEEIATHAPTTPAQATLDYFMMDYVDHLELHVRQILGKDWTAADV